ncbi:zinc-binding dehydrogenase [Streptomyces sp. NPDC102364]|uniref:zinc-dependent alcohol dehydrogenase n=1 Tax=Streptomyces sp. NPDC102364 TaxID=3366161 RepID=UPI00381083F7
MRAVVLDGQGTAKVEELPDPEPGADGLVVAPVAVGICGTDLHLAHGDYPTGRFPVVPGHEFSGTVVKVGPEVKGFAPGDRVCVDPNVACGACEQCRAGATNLCPDLVPIGVGADGACAELVRVPAKVVYRLPDGLDFATGALVEPLACVLHAASRIRPIKDQRVLVYGAGSIGLLAVAYARAQGASTVDVIEPSAVRRGAAVEFGADAVHAPGERPARHDVDLAIEASGHPTAVSDALDRLAKRGTLLQMGVVSPESAINLFPYDLFDRELSLVGSQSLATAFPDAVRAVLDLPRLSERMVTHTFGLKDYTAALEAARSDTARKVHILPQQ